MLQNIMTLLLLFSSVLIVIKVGAGRRRYSMYRVDETIRSVSNCRIECVVALMPFSKNLEGVTIMDGYMDGRMVV